MPITIDEVVEKGKQHKQLLTLAEKQEIAEQAWGIGQQGQWEELVKELHEDPELQEVFEDDQMNWIETTLSGTIPRIRTVE